MFIEINRSMTFRREDGVKFIIPPSVPRKDNEFIKFRTSKIAAPDWIRDTKEFELALSDGTIVELKELPKVKAKRQEAADLGIEIIDEDSGAKIITPQSAMKKNKPAKAVN